LFLFNLSSLSLFFSFPLFSLSSFSLSSFLKKKKKKKKERGGEGLIEERIFDEEN